MFHANVLRVMIASPGDVNEEREIVAQEIHRWNAANSLARQIVLLPVRWETHSTPELGAHPQAIINKQLLQDADIVIGIFGTKVGTPTAEYISGTVEEIKRNVASGKTTKLYFSDIPVAPSLINQAQMNLLHAFREECKSTGLYATFSDRHTFARDVAHHLNIELNQPRYKWLTTIEQRTEEVAPQTLSSFAIRMLKATAGTADGVVLFQEMLGGNSLRIGDEEFIDDNPRTEAKCRATLSELERKGFFEAVNKNVYRITDDGYNLVDGLVSDSTPETSAFAASQSKHVHELVESITTIQRDFLRFLLIKGGQVRNEVYFNARLPKPTGDWNEVVVPLVQKGLLMNAVDLREGTSTAVLNNSLKGFLAAELFPRKENSEIAFEGL